MMNELLRKRAIAVMDRLMQHPSVRPFISMPDSVSENGLDMNLSSIKYRLQENKYTKLQSWLADVEQCWANAEAKNAENPNDKKAAQEVVLAEHNRRLFDKEKRSIDLLSANNWGSEVVRLRGHIADIMNEPPPKVKQFVSAMLSVKTPKPAAAPASEEELKRFVEAAEKMDTDEENNEMMRIITDMQPDLLEGATNNRFDVSKLNAVALNALRTYVKAELEKRGEKYPE